MTVSIRNSLSNDALSASGTTITLPTTGTGDTSAALVSGDPLVVMIMLDGSGATGAAATGWTAIDSGTTVGSGTRFILKRTGGFQTGDTTLAPTWTGGGATRMAWSVIALNQSVHSDFGTLGTWTARGSSVTTVTCAASGSTGDDILVLSVEKASTHVSGSFPTSSPSITDITKKIPVGASSAPSTYVGAYTATSGTSSVTLTYQTASSNGAGVQWPLVSASVPVSATVNITGTGTVGATIAVDRVGAAAITGASTVSASIAVTRAGTATITGASTVVAIPSALEPVVRVAGLTAHAVQAQSATVAITGASVVTVSVSVSTNAPILRVAGLSAHSTQTAAAVVLRVAGLLAHSTQVSTGEVPVLRVAGLTAYAVQYLRVWSGSRWLDAATTTISPPIAITGSSTMGAAAVLAQESVVAIVGGSTMDVTGMAITSAAVAMTGASTVTVVGLQRSAVNVVVLGVSTVSVFTQAAVPVSIVGTGTLTTTGYQIAVGFIAIDGTGTLTAAVEVSPGISAVIAIHGDGTLTVTGIVVSHVVAPYRLHGTFAIIPRTARLLVEA